MKKSRDSRSAFTQEPSWSRRHKSALFIVVLSLFSTAALVVGAQVAASSFWHTGLYQLAGTGYSVALVTLFLTFRDVRETLAAVAAQLLYEGTVFAYFSEQARQKTKRQISLTDLKTRIDTIDDSLYTYVDDILHDSLARVHANNLSWHINLSRYEPDDSYLIEQLMVSYRLTAAHLAGRMAAEDFSLAFTVFKPEDPAQGTGHLVPDQAYFEG